MAAYSNFRSSTQIESEREELRAARKRVLERAKCNHEKSERQREQAKQAGEGTWMLQSVSDRISKEEKAMEKVKKKKKKHKKEKKTGQSSSSDKDSSDAEVLWVEKSSVQSENKPVKGPTLQRDSWMEGNMVTDIIPTITRAELREKVQGEEVKKKAEIKLMEQPGQHTRELNPYWKDGGTGVPANKPKASDPQMPSATGDGGLSWFRKAYDRCQQQAKDEGRTLEDVAAERFGSLAKLQSMIREAEGSSSEAQKRRHDQHFSQGPTASWRSHSPGHRRNDIYQGSRYKNNEKMADLSAQSRDKDGKKTEKNGREKERRNRVYEDRQKDDREGGRTFENVRETKRSGQYVQHSDQSAEKRQFVHPDDDDDSESDHELQSVSRNQNLSKPRECCQGNLSRSAASSLKGRFARPADSDDDESSKCQQLTEMRGRDRREHSDAKSSRRDEHRGWRKPGSPQERKPSPKVEHQKRRSPSSSSHNSSASSSSDSETSEEEKEKEPEKSEVPPVPVKILSEDEMNSLGAKILRAELMGDEDLARQLKDQLEQARKAKDAAPTPPAARATASSNTEDRVVVLTRTGRDGMVRPLPEQEFEREKGGKKRRKQKNISTHGKGGERARYFDDDDMYDLKRMVEMEKLGTAEDQNAMFARLAGRSVEQTNDDFQVDDMFVSRAAHQQSGSRNEEKERSKAIFEHRKISAAMNKCRFCFDKIPKHLIISIGHKVYLCLPAHRSLTPGHCLIVPMQHTPAATALDEDVWQELQLYRKQLVQMFSAQDKDVVFMETSMRLKHFPHMVLECVPVNREMGDMAPIYFKKAMQEAGPEWNSNKKIVDISRKDIRHSIPKGFPYFSVDFGLQGGYAHVIEEENTFPFYFGREIVGGMIDAEPGLWRKPHLEGFEDQRCKVMEFEKWWKPYEITS